MLFIKNNKQKGNKDEKRQVMILLAFYRNSGVFLLMSQPKWGVFVKKYICKSKLREVRKEYSKMFPGVPLSAFEEQFHKVKDSYIEITGSKFDRRRQRHTYYVNKDELLMGLYHEYFRARK